MRCRRSPNTGGITLEDFTPSRAYQEIFGLGEAREAAKVTLRQLEALAEPLLNFRGPGDLTGHN